MTTYVETRVRAWQHEFLYQLLEVWPRIQSIKHLHKLMLCRLVRVSGPLSGYHHNSFGYLAIMRAMCVKGLTLYHLKSHLQVFFQVLG
ncbi:putative transcription regulator Homeodomain-LIKE family [Helianthus annuus]|nr:putative transcription regulator Homeodomain-LIKE family [Helianthus annuus]